MSFRSYLRSPTRYSGPFKRRRGEFLPSPEPPEPFHPIPKAQPSVNATHIPGSIALSLHYNVVKYK